jgi:hypothetical protein
MMADVVERADMRMAERGNRARFALESLLKFGVTVSQQLDRHASIEPRVAGFIHLAHAARSEQPDDFIRAEMGSWLW